MSLITRQQFSRGCQTAWRRGHDERDEPPQLADGQRRTALFRAENLRLLLHYLRAHPCVDCGEADPIVLDFDRRDPIPKRVAVSKLVWRSTWAYIEAEMAKCDVRCANCHRRRTAVEFGWRKAALLGGSQQGRQGSNPRRRNP